MPPAGSLRLGPLSSAARKALCVALSSRRRCRSTPGTRPGCRRRRVRSNRCSGSPRGSRCLGLRTDLDGDEELLELAGDGLLLVQAVFFTYCWVMVEPLCVSPPWAIFTTARAIPSGRRRSRSRTSCSPPRPTAFCIDVGIWSMDDLAVALAAGGDHLGVVVPVVDVLLQRGRSSASGNAPCAYAMPAGPTRGRGRPTQMPRQLPGRHPAAPAVLPPARVVDQPLRLARPATPAAAVARPPARRRPEPARPAGLRAAAAAARWPPAAPAELSRPACLGPAAVRPLWPLGSNCAGRRTAPRGGGAAPLAAPRRSAAARPPPFDCGGLRRCSLILRATPRAGDSA